MVRFADDHQQFETRDFPDGDPLRTTEEFAAQARVRPRTPEAWRSRGIGPPYVKVGSRVFYRQSAIDEWLREQERVPTPAQQ